MPASLLPACTQQPGVCTSLLWWRWAPLRGPSWCDRLEAPELAARCRRAPQLDQLPVASDVEALLGVRRDQPPLALGWLLQPPPLEGCAGAPGQNYRRALFGRTTLNGEAS